MDENTVKKLALVITANCLRNTPVEKLNTSGAMSQAELKLLQKSMSDRMYTFLLYLLSKPAQEYSALMEELSRHYPADWPLPELDDSFIQIVGNSTQDASQGTRL
ncbi:hypothetical protein [Sansalvadorimonas verongulae]|uniref:hypothetical protein n=1 Tax=Sansalvadorimonas verongulae TaxID=2172824 RepID=UPI0012BC1C66|nr:hypothetical protein [Sansalvadorimonas verongulae]MTI12246.1 hypothetical protein [Sansalvadorimonas verongulae]